MSSAPISKTGLYSIMGGLLIAGTLGTISLKFMNGQKTVIDGKEYNEFNHPFF